MSCCWTLKLCSVRTLLSKITIPVLLVLVVVAITAGIVALVTSSKTDPGAALYQRHCQSCHLEEGQGLGLLIPPLAGSDWLVNHQDELACIIRYGQADTIIVNGNTYAEVMPGNEQLSDGQILNIINYINSAWGNELPAQSLLQVEEALTKCDR